MKLKFTSLLILAVYASAARASLTLTVGNYYLLPETPGQVIPIYILGGDAVQGDMLYVQVADGGPQANGSELGPTITKLDVITNSIFAGIDSGQTPSETGYVVDQLAVAGTTIRRDAGVTSVPGSGLVAMITVSTLGFTTIGESWEFCLKDTVEGGSTQFGDVPITITNGTLTIAAAPATSTWNGTANSYWYDASQWSTGVPGFGSGDQAAFTGNVIPRTIDLGATNQRLASLLLDSGTNSASWSVISTGGGKLLMDNGANTATIQVGNGDGHTIGTKIDLLSSTTINLSASSSLTLSGILNGPSTSTLRLQGADAAALILTGDNTLSGPVNILSGVLQVGSGGTTGFLGSGNVSNSGTVAFNRSDALAVSGTITGGGGIRQVGGGVTTLANYQGTGALAVNAGTLKLDTTNGARRTPEVLVQSSGVTVTNTAGVSALDATNHDLMIFGTPYSTIQTLVNNGGVIGLGDSGGPQITSSTAWDLSSTDHPTVQIAYDLDFTFGGGSYGDGSAIGFNDATFTDGVTVTHAGTVMVKYAYYGDVNFDGMVDAFDVNYIVGYLGEAPGTSDTGLEYLYGDVDFNGVVDAFDVNIVVGYLGVGSGGGYGDPLGTLGLPILTPTIAPATENVPEPASLLWFSFLFGWGLRRRKRCVGR